MPPASCGFVRAGDRFGGCPGDGGLVGSRVPRTISNMRSVRGVVSTANTAPDLNAARNLARLATLVEDVEHVEQVAGSGPETQTACGGDVRPGSAGPTSVKREAGTGPIGSGQTGTVASQGAAAWITTITDDR